MECASGYWQVPLAGEDGAKTAFCTPKAHYEYLRMAFGLKSARSTFQRLMNGVFMGLIGTRCFVYLDDVIIFGETLQEHHARLREVFNLDFLLLFSEKLSKNITQGFVKFFRS